MPTTSCEFGALLKPTMKAEYERVWATYPDPWRLIFRVKRIYSARGRWRRQKLARYYRRQRR